MGKAKSMVDLDNNVLDKGDDVLIFDVRAKIIRIKNYCGELVAECEDKHGHQMIGYSEEIFLVRSAKR